MEFCVQAKNPNSNPKPYPKNGGTRGARENQEYFGNFDFRELVSPQHKTRELIIIKQYVR